MLLDPRQRGLRPAPRGAVAQHQHRPQQRPGTEPRNNNVRARQPRARPQLKTCAACHLAPGCLRSSHTHGGDRPEPTTWQQRMLDNTRPYTSGRVNVRSASRGGVRPGAEELLRASMETHGKNKENVAASQRRARLSLPGFDLTAQNREGTPGGVDQLSADLAKGWPSVAPTPGGAATPAPFSPSRSGNGGAKPAAEQSAPRATTSAPTQQPTAASPERQKPRPTRGRAVSSKKHGACSAAWLRMSAAAAHAPWSAPTTDEVAPRKPSAGWRLRQACVEGDAGAVAELLRLGADPDSQCGGGCTPLLIACFGGHTQCATALVEAGAVVDGANDLGDTPLMVAAVGNHLDCAQLLLERRADVDRVNRSGNTALHRAALWGGRSVIAALLGCGARREVRNRAGLKPQSMSDDLETKRALNSGAETRRSQGGGGGERPGRTGVGQSPFFYVRGACAG